MRFSPFIFKVQLALKEHFPSLWLEGWFKGILKQIRVHC
jgi:hypothetical protein